MKIKQFKLNRDGTRAFVEIHVLSEDLVRFIIENSGVWSAPRVYKRFQDGKHVIAGDWSFVPEGSPAYMH